MTSEKPKKKSDGWVLNKTAEIRKVAKSLVVQGKPPRPKDIRQILETKGIKVTSQQVSMSLSKTEFAYKGTTASGKEPLSPTSPKPFAMSAPMK